jgi:hypothetical protein
MAANLMETSTTAWGKLMGNGRHFRVPPYQRDYAWREDQWQDLWDDIVALREDPERLHFLGTLVLAPTSRDEDQVIDGQQRLTTLCLLVIAIVAELRALAERGIDADANRRRADYLQATFLRTEDQVTFAVRHRITLSETDDAVFRVWLSQGNQPPNIRKFPVSVQGLAEGLRAFRARIVADPSLASDGGAMAGLVQHTMAAQLVFLEVRVADALSAYTVFETLNARGTALTSTDLLKNELFSRAGVRLDDVRAQWASLVETVGYESFPDFLRYHLLCTHKQVTGRRLFTVAKEYARDADSVLELLCALQPRAELFAALLDGSNPWWLSEDLKAAADHAEVLRRLDARQAFPLIFAAWERLHDRFAQVLRLIVVITFRHTTVGRRNPNELRVYADGARALLSGAITTYAGLRTLLAQIYVDDAIFEGDMRAWRPKRELARYALCALESDARGAPGSVSHVTDPGTLEHLLPRNAGDAWADAVPPERQAALVERLGNFALLKRSTNRQIGNLGWAEKRPMLQASDYVTTQRAAEVEVWNGEAIDRRQAALARRAVHIWRAD